jgi:hypothetical protein
MVRDHYHGTGRRNSIEISWSDLDAKPQDLIQGPVDGTPGQVDLRRIEDGVEPRYAKKTVKLLFDHGPSSRIAFHLGRREIARRRATRRRSGIVCLCDARLSEECVEEPT